jgi:hypothetical protein
LPSLWPVHEPFLLAAAEYLPSRLYRSSEQLLFLILEIQCNTFLSLVW